MGNINDKLCAYMRGEMIKSATTFPLMMKAVIKGNLPILKEYLRTGRLNAFAVPKQLSSAVHLFGREMAATKGKAHKWYPAFAKAKEVGFTTASRGLNILGKMRPAKGFINNNKYTDYIQVFKGEARHARNLPSIYASGTNPFSSIGINLYP